MKKVLFATTALIATAGVASAAVNLSGSARFALQYQEGRTVASGSEEVFLHNRFTLNIDGSAETDDGLNFFARVRIRGGNSGSTGLAASGVSAPRVGVTSGGFTFAVGNILGALESTPGLYGGAIGLTGLNWYNVVSNVSGNRWNWDSFSSAGAGVNGVEIIYASGAFSGHLSYSESTQRVAGHLAYSFGDWTVALGAQDGSSAGTADMVVGTVSGSVGNWGMGAAVGDIDGNTSWTLYADTTFGAGTTVRGYVADDEVATDTVFGIGFTHSLGGAVLAGGILSNPTGAVEADLGVRFSF